MNLILGAGLAGLSCSYHLGHQNCLILERSLDPFGRLKVEHRNGCTWDQGPHVSFTKHAYVRDLFSANVDADFEEYDVRLANYFRGSWIDHPAQCALHQVPEPLRTQCLESFLAERRPDLPQIPSNYAEWLESAFGPVFARTFPAAYTRKYWTRQPHDLTCDWVGQRVYRPNAEDVVAGSNGPLAKRTNYIQRVRYPRRGGYQSFVARLASGARIVHGAEATHIDLENKRVATADGRRFEFSRLINTLPLPLFVSMCVGVPDRVREAVRHLSCSQLLIANITAQQPFRRPYHWMYVYDEDLLSTRITCTEALASSNAAAGTTGLQVEVYFAPDRPLPGRPNEIARRIESEVVAMGLVDEGVSLGSFTQHIAWANVIFTHNTKPALDCVFEWLQRYGLEREAGDSEPLTSWQHAAPVTGALVLAGRYGQWKYYWTDDCVLRGAQIARVTV